MTNEMLHVNDSKTTDSKAPVAMEMSLKTWRLAMAVEGQPRKRVKTVEAGNYLELTQAVADAKARFKLPGAVLVVFCYEAGRDGFYPYRRLTELGHEVWVIDSASIEVSRQQRRAKSDGIDADKLSELMQRQARGEKALPIVRVSPLEVEDQRLLTREREVLLEDLQRVRNRIASLLFTQGYREVPKRARGLQAWLDRDIERLSLLEQQFQAVGKAMRLKVREERKTAMAQVARSLMRLCGIGWVGAWVLASEMYGWRTFRNRREVDGVP
ncbi:MAG: IS110 family transposase [Gammaproteobacteria bacterium]